MGEQVEKSDEPKNNDFRPQLVVSYRTVSYNRGLLQISIALNFKSLIVSSLPAKEVTALPKPTRPSKSTILLDKMVNLF